MQFEKKELLYLNFLKSEEIKIETKPKLEFLNNNIFKLVIVNKLET